MISYQNTTSIESKFVSNEFLFELKQADLLEIDPYLVKFLLENEFPWLSLGKKLTTFIEEMLSRIEANKKILGNVSPKAYLEKTESIYIAEGAIVEPGAFISGPCYIAPYAVVRHGAYIRGSVFVSSHAVVGHTTECKGCILLNHAKAAHFNYVGDSILGVECNLGAGTKLANLKINAQNIFLRIDNKKVDSKLKKFGAILANRAQTGCNAVTNPGTIMLPDTVILANQTGFGIIR